MKDISQSKIEERYSGGLDRYFDVVEGYAVRNQLDNSGPRFLDLGCGSGRFIPLLTSAGKQLVGVDLCFSDLKIAANKNRETTNPALLTQCDATALPLPNSCTDVVLAMGIFQFTEDLGIFLKELQRVTKPGGMLIFSIWNKPTFNLPSCLSIDSAQRQHDVSSVLNAIGQYGFQASSIEYTFFMPRRLFWWGYRLTRMLRLHNPYLLACTWFELRLRRSAHFEKCGWEMIVTANKVTANETV